MRQTIYNRSILVIMLGAARPSGCLLMEVMPVMFMFTDYDQHLLDHVKKLHFIGCGGSGMYPLIQILAAKGYQITGSDVLDGSIIRAEREMGVQVTLGHKADNVIGSDKIGRAHV